MHSWSSKTLKQFPAFDGKTSVWRVKKVDLVIGKTSSQSPV